MTPGEAQAGVGRGVVYHAKHGGPAEDGVITSANERWAFVRYGVQAASKATDPADLEFLVRPS